MAFQDVRHASVFVDSKLVAECSKSDMTIATGDERLYGDAGVAGVSDGADETDFDFDTFIPVNGASVDPVAMALAKKTFELQYGSVGGKILSVQCRFKSVKISSDSKAGTLTGSFQIFGGKAQQL